MKEHTTDAPYRFDFGGWQCDRCGCTSDSTSKPDKCGYCGGLL